MKGRAGETLATCDVRKDRLLQKAGGADESIRDIGVALGRLDVPATISELCCDDLLVEADILGQAAVVRDLFNIRPDLSGRSIFARPIVIGLEWKLVLAR